MALATSPLSQVCKGIRNHLDSAINSGTHSKVNVVIDTPAVTAGTTDIDTAHYLNLFFYRFEPSGLFPDSQPGDTGWLRAFCLITPFACKEDSIGIGEGDLKLVGEVVRIFQEKPIFLLTVDGEDYHLQVIFQPLALDQLNQLWSTQGDTIYRPSVLFEISLAPVVPSKRSVPAPLAGGFGLDVQVRLDRRDNLVTQHTPVVPVMVPSTQVDNWTPAISFVYQQTCAFSLSLALHSPELMGSAGNPPVVPATPAFVAQVWLAGKPGETVKLRWQTWDKDHGWQNIGPANSAIISDTRINPGAITDAHLLSLDLPFNDHIGQMLLHAERSYTRSDGVVVSVLSNPLLISLYEA